MCERPGHAPGFLTEIRQTYMGEVVAAPHLDIY
jgi:hypothetical protein